MNVQRYKVLERGQALITLLVFMIIGLTITSAAIVMILVNSSSGTKQQQGELAYQIAQSGAENAVLRVLRTPPPAYTGETLPVGNGQAVITVTGSGTVASPYVILSRGELGNFVRQVEIQARYENNLFEITSEREVY
jgi:hypothetical protein